MTGESGQVGGVEAVAFGLLVLVVGILLVSNVWGVIDAETAARTAAREGARAYVKASTSDPTVARAIADRAALDTVHELGWTAGSITASVGGAAFVRCAVVTYAVTIPVPVFRLPWIGSGPAALRASAHHTERVDPYRSGTPGTADCGGPG